MVDDWGSGGGGGSVGAIGGMELGRCCYGSGGGAGWLDGGVQVVLVAEPVFTQLVSEVVHALDVLLVVEDDVYNTGAQGSKTHTSEK